MEKQATWIQKNFVLVLHTVFKLTGCKKLQDYCLKSICEDPEPFITSKKFPSLDKDILYGLLKRDDFPVEEVIIWDCLIKWGIEQTSGLGKKNSDRTKWNNSNYQALKKTLNLFIPLIRFTEFSPDEYFDKIRPYNSIIPNNIRDEIEEFYFKNIQPKTIILTPRIKLTGCNKLQDYCLESICADPESFITSKKFSLLDKDILYDLLKRNDFSVKEAIIWDCLIKWGIEQIPGLGKKIVIEPSGVIQIIKH
jgi:hypothetical protein